jgi:PAS domain S-box-containing protein
VDHAADAFFLHDEQARVLDVNRRACESLGYTRDELIGVTPAEFNPDLTPALFEDRVRKIIAGETIAFESRHRRKDGMIFPVEIRSRAFWEGGRRFIVSLARDITERQRLEAELRQAKDRLDLAIRASNVGIWEVDMPDGVYAHGTGSWINVWEQLGYPAPDSSVDFATMGAPWHPEDRGRVEQAIQAYFAGQTAEFQVEYRARHRDGSYRWFLSRGTAIRDQAGKPIRLVGSRVDITELKRVEEVLRESEAWFRFLANAMPQIVWTARPDGSPEYLNDRFVEYTGVPVAEITGDRWPLLLHPDDRERTMSRWMADVAKGSAHDTEFRLRGTDGAYRWVKARGVPVRDESGQLVKWVGTMTDIDDQKRAEEAERQAKEAAEAASRAKDEFLANVSHEIRTPMNAILGMTELVLDTPLTGDQRQCLRTVQSAADSLLGIINDLLDFSKIEAGKLELAPADFSLRAAVSDTLRALAVRAHKKGLELIYDVQPEAPDALVGDAARLRQVLLNLVGNAIKFTEAGEAVVRVEVASDAAPEGDVGLRFSVRDTGVGIPEGQQERIFRAFEQEDSSTTRRYGGTGLGLTIAARLVALMGGTITVDSAPGRGSTFAFTAHFARQPPGAEPVAAWPPAQLRDLRVLIVDDNATNRHILEEWLRSWRMEPEAVGHGLAALNALWRALSVGRPYALVLLDARMPETDGLALPAQIRDQAELAAIRIILLTSGDRPGDLARSRELRIDAHLFKPLQQDELLEAIYRVMSRANGEATAARSAPAEGATPAPPLRILVAEDNEFNKQHLEGLLARRGHTVHLADNGREALALLGIGGQGSGAGPLPTPGPVPLTPATESRPLTVAFDLLLLDLQMPELDGFQVVGAIRDRERATGGHLPVIALTARSRPEDRRRCLAAGMDDYLAKPVRSAELFAAIERLASSRGVPG